MKPPDPASPRGDSSGLLAAALTATLALASGPAGAAAGTAAAAWSPPEPRQSTAGPLRLTLAEAVERARQASARLAQLRSLAGAAGAGLTGARAARLPQVDASAAYTRNSNVPELAVALPGLGRQTLFPNIPDNYRAHLGFALPLYTAGRTAQGIAAADRQLAAAGQDLLGGVADLVLEATAAYWSLVTARESERVLAESVMSYEAHLKEARDRHDLGLVASNEVLAVQVQRDQAELSRLQAENGAAVANANLLRLLDLPDAVQVEPIEPLEALEPAPTPGSAGSPGRSLLGEAETARPEIAALRSRIEATLATARATRAGLLPQASLAAGYDYANPNNRILPLEPRWRSSWNVGATLSLALFDGGRTAAAAAQLEAQAEASRQLLLDLERRVRLEVTTRLLELSTARQAALVAGRNLEAARENLRVARDRYHEGVIPSSELLDAETALLRSGLDRTSALTQVRVALANLDRALGRTAR
ncbi:MAG TPA: TolC family protein [Thermoanaerobaculia bacterium]|nr:TolC family protein [Thermoanaerobaculia bacterium]